MTDAECVELLRWALPRLGARWPGFRRVRRQVCRRIGRRMRELGLADPAAYRARLETHADEWERLDAMCRIPISRFFRDRGFHGALEREVLPTLAGRARGAGRGTLRAWSAGCASGEEPYGLAILWNTALAPRFRDLRLEIVATDADPHLLARARRARYRASSLKEVPAEIRARAFARCGELHALRPEHREGVTFLCQDVRHEAPQGCFDLVLCRNLAFTYFDAAQQARVLARLLAHLREGGALGVGLHESLPEVPGLRPWPGARGLHERGRPRG